MIDHKRNYKEMRRLQSQSNPILDSWSKKNKKTVKNPASENIISASVEMLSKKHPLYKRVNIDWVKVLKYASALLGKAELLTNQELKCQKLHQNTHHAQKTVLSLLFSKKWKLCILFFCFAEFWGGGPK